MPYTSCCVALCVSSSKRTPNLQFYRLPEEGEERRDQWLRLIRNDSLTRQATSQLARICSLHFLDGVNANNGCPSVFPWSKEWASVITKYNTELAQTQKPDGPQISPVPLLTPETTGVEVPSLKSVTDDTNMSVDGELAEGRSRVGSSQSKGKKRLRIWVDESDGDDEHGDRNYDESETGNYMVVSDQLGEATEKRVSLPDSITGTAVAVPKAGEVVTMAVTPNTNKMSVHEKAFFSPYHSSQVLNKLTDLWRLGKMCDATICVGYTIRIKAHKLVLASMSSVIMNMAAKTDGAILELQLPGDLNVDAVQKFITYLYEGVLYLSATTVMDIQRLATIFKVESVLGYCQTFLLGMPAQTLENRGQISPQSSLVSQVSTPPAYPLVQSVVGHVVPAGLPVPAVGSPSPQPLALQLRPATSSTDTDNWPKRPVLRQQSTIDEDVQQYGKYTSNSPSILHGKRVQELKGIWKRSYDTSEERSSPVTGVADPLIGSPLTGDHGSTKGTDSPGGSFDQPDLGAVKTEPEDSATESGEESNQTLPGSVQFREGSSEGMDPPDTHSVSRHRSKTLTSDPLLANNDPALLTQQVRNAMPKTGVLFENLPIPDGFLSESNPEQQRRYMASLLERTQTSAIPENQRQYRCLFCPSSFVKAKSCVVHVIETHQVQAKDVLKYVSIERRGSTQKDKLRGKCSMCDYKVNRNYDHLHYHKYFKHGIALPEGYQLYRCEICGKESSSKYNWRTHMDTCHFLGNTCEMCEQSFNSREELADHYRNFHISKRASPPKKRLRRLTKNVSAPADTSQSRSYIYKCPECSFESVTKDDIVSHMASAHDQPMDMPDLRQTVTGEFSDKDRLQRAQSADTQGQETFRRVKSEDTEDSKEETSFNEETGSVSNHSEYECESPDSSVVQPKEQE